MKVYIAKKAGFCMGVRRAVDLTLDLVNNGEQNIATYGPLIHNPQVLDVLADKGVGILDKAPEQAADLGTVIIRAHGIPAAEKKNLLDMGLMVKDATCPRVLKVQAIIRKYRKQGMTTVIVGDRNHAEVEGLMGYAGPDCKVVSNEGDAHRLELAGDYIIVSQQPRKRGHLRKFAELLPLVFRGAKFLIQFVTLPINARTRFANYAKMSRPWWWWVGGAVPTRNDWLKLLRGLVRLYF